jgi:hypothetical protein
MLAGVTPVDRWSEVSPPILHRTSSRGKDRAETTGVRAKNR